MPRTTRSTSDAIALQVAGLSPAVLDLKPRSRDWSELAGEYAEGWRALAAPTTPAGDHAKWITDADDLEHIADAVDLPAWIDADPTSDTFGDEVDPYEDSIEPMMSYDYPLPDHFRALNETDADALSGLPLCIVSYEDSGQSLALTGGGMDLSWEICESFVRLGLLPPVHFCDLPAMAGRGGEPQTSPAFPDGERAASYAMWEQARADRDALIIAACRRSVTEHAERVAYRATSTLASLDRIAGVAS